MPGGFLGGGEFNAGITEWIWMARNRFAVTLRVFPRCTAQNCHFMRFFGTTHNLTSIVRFVEMCGCGDVESEAPSAEERNGPIPLVAIGLRSQLSFPVLLRLLRLLPFCGEAGRQARLLALNTLFIGEIT